MKHLLSIADLDRAAIERILRPRRVFAEVSDREIKKVPALRGRTVLNLFYEASTRTRSSFELAAKRLSADVVNFAASGSSVEKGESLKDTVLTLAPTSPTRSSSAPRTPAPPHLVARLDRRRDRQRRRRQARAPDPGAARRLHAAPAARRLDGATSGSSATCCTRASRARTSSPFRRWAPTSPSAARRRSSRARSRRSAATCATRSTTCARPTSSTRCACSTSA